MLIPSIADEVALPLIAAGGFADGRGLAAARMLGAAGVAMGTRLATVQESPLHPRTRAEILARPGADTVYTDRFDGMDCRILRTASAERILRRRTGLLAAFSAWFRLARESSRRPGCGCCSASRREARRMPYAWRAQRRPRTRCIGPRAGRSRSGRDAAGQVQELIRDAPKAAELIARTVREAEVLLVTRC